MEKFFLLLYGYFRDKRIIFFSLVTVVGLTALLLASRLSFEEDITKMIAGVDKKAEVTRIIEQSKFLDKVVITVSLADSNRNPDPETLIRCAEKLTDTLQSIAFQPYVKNIASGISGSAMEEVYDIVYRNLPVFLDEEDYNILDSMIMPERIRVSLENSYNTLLSPASFAMKPMIIRDPIGISGIALKKLGSSQQDENYLIIDGHVFSKDKKHLLLFLTTVFPSGATSQNTLFVRQFDDAIDKIEEAALNQVSVEYFGSAVVAVGNAERLKKDIRLTLSITITLLLLIISFSIRKKRLFPFIFLPAVFGGLTALAVIYLIQAKISVISLSIGTVILAITVDYALHITTHYKHRHSITETIKDVSFPIIVCGFATAFEFISLVFVSSESLHELGILAAISVLTASFFTLVVIPHILDMTRGKEDMTEEKNTLERVLDKITRYNFHKNKLLLLFMVAVTLICWFFVSKVGFESDMMKMNYISRELAKTEENLNRINSYKLHSVYVVAHGENLQQALRRNERMAEMGMHMLQEKKVSSFSSPGALLYSDSLQQRRIQRWNEWWNEDRKNSFRENFDRAATLAGFRSSSFSGFLNLIDKEYVAMEPDDFSKLQAYFYTDNISASPQLSTVVSVLKVDEIHKDQVTEGLKDMEGIVVMDRKSMLSGMVETLGRDFNFIANVSLTLILVILILAFGRFELGFITFVPILLSWMWTLGFMGITGIKFNIFNIIISSFITGLGIDYSIYIMQGLVQGYKSDNKNLLSYKTCILISVMISISGTGVLILARHPSLHSIALISIVGLLSVVLISYTFEPLFFNWLVSKKGKSRVLPVTLTDVLITLITLTVSLLLSIFMNLLLFLVFPLPFSRKAKQRFLRRAMTWCLKVPVYGMVNIKKTIINEGREDFSIPSVVIANHQSHLDLPLLLMLSPKIIVLTNSWVWNNPVYALVIRYLDFYPVTGGYEGLVDKLKKKVEEGYSILVFPEGTRSPDSSIKRFHKGAFLLAGKLHIDIVPIFIHGAGDCMNKGENHLKGGQITVKIYPRIKAADERFGRDYHERTKAMLRFYRREFEAMRTGLETPSYFRRKLIRNYIYKGPVLEWYTRIKLSLEKNYSLVNSYVPRDASIVDIGCGYGMMSYMLSFTSEKRSILGIDYDSDKIELAGNCISKNDRIRFVAADAVSYAYENADVFLLSDVLHYIPEEKQDSLMKQCINHLNPGGCIIVRDADRDLHKRHRGTRYTEFFSTRFGYNKAVGKKLYFFPGRKISEMAKQNGLEVEIIDNSRLTSNLYYILRRTKKATE